MVWPPRNIPEAPYIPNTHLQPSNGAAYALWYRGTAPESCSLKGGTSASRPVSLMIHETEHGPAGLAVSWGVTGRGQRPMGICSGASGSDALR